MAILPACDGKYGSVACLGCRREPSHQPIPAGDARYFGHSSKILRATAGVVATNTMVARCFGPWGELCPGEPWKIDIWDWARLNLET
jgi:hypothetical protein